MRKFKFYAYLRAFLFLLIVLLLMPTFISNVYAQQNSGYYYVQVVDKAGNPIPYADAWIRMSGEIYWGGTAGADGNLPIWLESDPFGKPIEISIRDIFNYPLEADKSQIICDKVNDVETVRVLNARMVIIKVYDSYRGEASIPPPIVAIVNTYSTMRHTVRSYEKIFAVLPNDFEGLLSVGAPLRKTASITATKDRNEYEALLEPVVKLTATLSGEMLY